MPLRPHGRATDSGCANPDPVQIWTTGLHFGRVLHQVEVQLASPCRIVNGRPCNNLGLFEACFVVNDLSNYY